MVVAVNKVEAIESNYSMDKAMSFIFVMDSFKVEFIMVMIMVITVAIMILPVITIAMMVLSVMVVKVVLVQGGQQGSY